MSLADRMLANGCALHVERIHGDLVEIMDGPHAGEKFVGVIEIEPDMVLDTALGADPRPRRIVRFRVADAPALTSTTRVRIDGRTWTLNRINGASHLSADFEMTEA